MAKKTILVYNNIEKSRFEVRRDEIWHRRD